MDAVSLQLHFTRADLTALAEKILTLDPDPAPRFLVLRDLLRCAPDTALFREAEQAANRSRWVRELESAQQPDGSWGRFHSQDTRVKTPIPTTEFAVRRALALGLDRRSPMLLKTVNYIQAHLQGQLTWSDPPEKHDHPGLWSVNILSVSAAMLALIDPDHPLLDPFWKRWAEIVSAAFESGRYDPQAELSRHQSLVGVPSRRLYPFHVFYPLVILSCTHHSLPEALERQMLEFLFHKPGGIYYIHDQPLDRYPSIDEKGFETWLHALEVLSCFPQWPEFAAPALNWIWAQRGKNGLWEIDHSAYRSYAFPLSESWRRAGNKRVDCSVWILRLIQQVFL